jgi:hypothetical protein
MAGLDPAIHALLYEVAKKDVDARVKPGHDDLSTLNSSSGPSCACEFLIPPAIAMSRRLPA